MEVRNVQQMHVEYTYRRKHLQKRTIHDVNRNDPGNE